MKTYQDIGSAIKSKIEDHKDSPDVIVWTTIEKKLKRRRKRRLLLWYFSLGVATAIIFSITFSTFENNNKDNFKPTQHNTPTMTSFSENEDFKKRATKDSSNQHIGKSTSQVSESAKNIKPKNDSKTKEDLLGYKSISKKQVETPKTLVRNGSYTNKNSTDKLYIYPKDKTTSSDSSNIQRSSPINILTDVQKNQDVVKPDLQEIKDSLLIDKTKKLKSKEKRETVKDSLTQREIRWSINPQFIISKYGAFKAKTSNDITTNYGVLLGYKMSEKAFLRLGIRKLRLFNKIENEEITIEYLEFPFELKYLLNDKKINPFLTTGTSFFRLQNNSTENTDERDYYKSTLSLNFGIGIEYKLLEKFYLNIESNFNYQIKPLSENINYRPYIILVSFGVDYRF